MWLINFIKIIKKKNVINITKEDMDFENFIEMYCTLVYKVS